MKAGSDVASPDRSRFSVGVAETLARPGPILLAPGEIGEALAEATLGGELPEDLRPAARLGAAG
jgi:hypothetical protein